MTIFNPLKINERLDRLETMAADIYDRMHKVEKGLEKHINDLDGHKD